MEIEQLEAFTDRDPTEYELGEVVFRLLKDGSERDLTNNPEAIYDDDTFSYKIGLKGDLTFPPTLTLDISTLHWSVFEELVLKSAKNPSLEEQLANYLREVWNKYGYTKNNLSIELTPQEDNGYLMSYEIIANPWVEKDNLSVVFPYNPEFVRDIYGKLVPFLVRPITHMEAIIIPEDSSPAEPEIETEHFTYKLFREKMFPADFEIPEDPNSRAFFKNMAHFYHELASKGIAFITGTLIDEFESPVFSGPNIYLHEVIDIKEFEEGLLQTFVDWLPDSAVPRVEVATELSSLFLEERFSKYREIELEYSKRKYGEIINVKNGLDYFYIGVPGYVEVDSDESNVFYINNNITLMYLKKFELIDLVELARTEDEPLMKDVYLHPELTAKEFFELTQQIYDEIKSKGINTSAEVIDVNMLAFVFSDLINQPKFANIKSLHDKFLNKDIFG